MTFAKAVKTELRATFGPKWIASAVQFAVVAVGLCFVFAVGQGVVEIAQTAIVAPMESLK